MEHFEFPEVYLLILYRRNTIKQHRTSDYTFSKNKNCKTKGLTKQTIFKQHLCSSGERKQREHQWYFETVARGRLGHSMSGAT